MFHFNINVDIEARQILATTIKKFEENKRAERIAVELQLMKENNANEQFSRLHPAIDRLARLHVERVKYSVVGDVLSVSTTPNEIRVCRKERVGALIFAFDSLTREVQIVFEGKVQQHRILRVTTGTDSADPILTYQRLPDEPFEAINMNNLPAIVNECVVAVI